MKTSSALIAAVAAFTLAAAAARAADDVPAPADGTNLTKAVQQQRDADCTGSIDAVARTMPDAGTADPARAMSVSQDAYQAAQASLQAARLAQKAGEQAVCATLVEATRDLLGQERAPEQAATTSED